MRQGVADIIFIANPGDAGAFFGTSIYENSDDAVVVYGVKHDKGDNVFNKYSPNLVARTGAIMPDPDANNWLPEINAKINFSSYDSKFRGARKKHFLFTLHYTH